MITTITSGITIHSAAEGAIVQTVKVTNKREKSLVTGMVSGTAQIVKVFPHSETNEFEVTGKGDLTMAAGISTDVDITLLTGGILMVDQFMYEQKVADSSDWSYQGVHYPHAA